MDRLVEHARAELELLGVEPRTAATLEAAVAVLTSGQPSPPQFRHMVTMLWSLLAGRPLSPLTANPAEWREKVGVSVSSRVWVNRRDGRAVSTDAGRTYRLTDDPREHVRTAAAPRGWVLALRELDGMSETDATEAVGEYLDAGPMTDVDRRMADSLPAGALRRDFLESRWGRRGCRVAALLLGDHADGGADGSSLAEVA